MKTLLIIAVILFAGYSQSQIQNIFISPSTPTTADSIFIEVPMQGGGFYGIDTSFIEFSGDSIHMVEYWCHECYFLIGWTESRFDTLSPLQAGTYYLTFSIDRYEQGENGCFGNNLCTADEEYTVSFTVTGQAGIDELDNFSKKRIKILDLMGRETEEKPNTLLIYQYDDGTSEKVFRIE